MRPEWVGDQECLIKLDPLLVHCRSRIPIIAQDEFGQTIEKRFGCKGITPLKQSVQSIVQDLVD